MVDKVTIEITGNDWIVIMSGLNELPRKISEPVVQKLAQQIVEQTKPGEADGNGTAKITDS